MSKNVYLFVPFEYKDQAKALGAKWDPEKKRWYTTSENKNCSKLTDTYQFKNFYSNATGYHMIPNPKTLKETSDEKNEKKEDYIKRRDDYVLKLKEQNGDGFIDDDNFGKSYSVNHLNHE